MPSSRVSILSNSALTDLILAGYPGIYGGLVIAQTLLGDNDHLGGGDSVCSPCNLLIGKMPYTVYPASYINEVTTGRAALFKLSIQRSR